MLEMPSKVRKAFAHLPWDVSSIKEHGRGLCMALTPLLSQVPV